MKKLFHFIKKNYWLVVLLGIIAFVSSIFIYRLFYSKSTYVYVKVKLGQGLWWASTQQPPLWIVDSINNDKNESQTSIQILKVVYYPFFTTGSSNQFVDQFDVYLYLKLKVTKKNRYYLFNRSIITVGAPIDLEFLKTNVSGAIISLSDQPINEKYIKKVVYLTKQYPSKWEYEAIQVGDYYFDGESKAFEIVDKDINIDEQVITVKAKIKVRMADDQLIFNNEKFLNVGKNINIITNNFNFNNYYISKID